MPSRLLQLDDLRYTNTPEKIASLFQKLGYNAAANQLAIEDLRLSERSMEAIWDAYLIADQGQGALQVMLFRLQEQEFSTPSIASNRMRAIAASLCRRPSNFLLLGTKDYNQLILVNPRKSFDKQMDVKVSIRKLLIDRTNPTNYDRDRLEAIAVNGKNPQELYQAQCAAFDVEKLTKQFYKGYRELFEKVQSVIRNHNLHPYFDDDGRLHQFSQRLLGRIMFLYFLQKKEFLAGDRSFLKNQYKNLRDPDETDFYTKILEPLFFETLNCQRSDFASPWGQIPYLNGGLFDKDYGIEIRDAAGRETPEQVIIPNSLFDPGSQDSVLSFFNSYNFTVAENTPGDEDVAVDPEMLGKVFENMLAAEERGQSGTFYTPRGIVQFMCTEVLCRYLADGTAMGLETIRDIIDYDPDLTDAEFNSLMSPQQARSLKKAVENIKVLDPAVGSGAFPLGMMQMLLNVRQAIARREGMTISRGSLTISQWKREIIANNLYGVDIKPEAIEIAKLRMWLSLVVDIPNIADVEPLPNLDYKLMCGDSLISTIHGEQLISNPNEHNVQLKIQNVTPIQGTIQPLLDLQHRYFDAQTEERHQLRGQILKAEANVFRVAVDDRCSYWFGKQKELEAKITAMKGKVSKAQEKERHEIAAKLAELERFAIKVEQGERSLNFFQYHLHFRDVFESKGGFDVVIGNPPYVRQESIKELKPALDQEYECYTGRADLYVYFYEQGLRLLKPKGVLSYISSNKWLNANYGVNLRKHLAANSQIHSITDFGELPVFDAATFPMIFIVQKNKIQQQSVLFTQVKSLQSPYPNVSAIVKEQGQLLPNTALKGDNWTLTDRSTAYFINKIKLINITLNEYVNGQIYWGVKTGYNQAFVIDQETKDKLISESPQAKYVIKKLIVGDDVRQWCIEYKNKYLIYLHHGVNISTLNAVINYLKSYKEQLEKRATKQEWYELQQPQFQFSIFFDKPKIVYPEISREPRFTLDNEGKFINNKIFTIPLDDKYLLGVLNSFIVWHFLKNICSVLGDPEKGGRLELRTIYMSKIPIPTASEPDRLAIESLVQKCLDAKGVGVKEWEAEIDDRVAHLYGLTAEEMKIIRGE